MSNNMQTSIEGVNGQGYPRLKFVIGRIREERVACRKPRWRTNNVVLYNKQLSCHRLFLFNMAPGQVLFDEAGFG
jgi:hypothetical protein